MDKLIGSLDRQFAQLHQESLELIKATSPEQLYYRPVCDLNSFSVHSCGEQILRSAATVEQTFGGITANLWDDPFEWTLPESLSTQEKIIDYLQEVETTRKRGFESFRSAEDLMKTIMCPSGETQLLPLLLDTLVRAAHYLGSARTTLELVRTEAALTTEH